MHAPLEENSKFKHEDLAISMYFLMMLMLMFFFFDKKKRKKIILQDFINKHITNEISLYCSSKISLMVLHIYLVVFLMGCLTLL